MSSGNGMVGTKEESLVELINLDMASWRRVDGQHMSSGNGMDLVLRN